jgi:hypothetical protein
MRIWQKRANKREKSGKNELQEKAGQIRVIRVEHEMKLAA